MSCASAHPMPAVGSQHQVAHTPCTLPHAAQCAQHHIHCCYSQLHMNAYLQPRWVACPPLPPVLPRVPGVHASRSGIAPASSWGQGAACSRPRSQSVADKGGDAFSSRHRTTACQSERAAQHVKSLCVCWFSTVKLDACRFVCHMRNMCQANKH